MPKPKEGWRRDLTLDAQGATWFRAPHSGIYWVVNQSGSPVILLQAGKSTYVIPDQTFYKFITEEQEQIGFTGGTAGKVVTVTDEADVKPIPQNKDVLGKFNLSDATGTNVASVDSTGRLTVLVSGAITTSIRGKGIAGGAEVEPTFDDSSFPGNVIIYVEPIGASGGAYHQSGNNTADSANKMGVMPAVAVSSLPSNTNTNIVPLYEDTSGRLRVRIDAGWIQPNTLTEKQSFAPVSVAASTAETVQNTGGVTLALGQIVFYQISAGPVTTLTTAADTLTYVAIKGATSGNYYAVAFLEQVVSGSFPMPVAEKLNIVVRNQDTAAHAFSGMWTSMVQT